MVEQDFRKIVRINQNNPTFTSGPVMVVPPCIFVCLINEIHLL